MLTHPQVGSKNLRGEGRLRLGHGGSVVDLSMAPRGPSGGHVEGVLLGFRGMQSERAGRWF